MEKSGSTKTELIALRNYSLLLIVIWTVFVGLILLLGFQYQKYENNEIARIQALNSFEKDLVYRRWAANHGGVYAPITENTPPNPYLAHIEERDITTPSGRSLTLVNPANMTRQVHEVGLEQYGLRGHITSLKPIRPANAADEWETRQLRAFEQGVQEVCSIAQIENQDYMRFMRPLITEQRCLKCHAEQGYKAGDLRGGISVSVAMAPIQVVAGKHMVMHVGGLFVFWLLGLTGIVLGGQRFKQRIKERMYAENELKKTYDELDIRVQERTAELTQTNDSLKKEITGRKQVEDSLNTMREFTDHLIQTANVMIIGFNADGRITHFNPAAEKITGYKLSEINKLNWFEAIVPHDKYHAVYDEFSRLIKGGLPKNFENPILTKSGEERFISWSNSNIIQGDDVVGIISFGIDISKRKHAEEAVQEYQQRLRALAFQLTIAEEKERRRIAIDLHDNVSQTLALSRIQIALALKVDSRDKLETILREISDSILQVDQDTRNIIYDLSPPQMNEIGLKAAISDWLEQQVEKKYGLKTKFITEGWKKSLDNDTRAILFRNVRELLTNVARHAHASKVYVYMENTDDNLKVLIRDDGKGFDFDGAIRKRKTTGGLGLFSIRERMRDLGGSLEIKSEPGTGCTACLILPMDKDGSLHEN